MVVKAKAQIYVADGSQVWIFPEKRGAPPTGSITQGVTNGEDLSVDRNGSLYVANHVFAGDTVTVYPSGSLKPSVTYSQDLNYPLYPVVDSRGNLFVSNAGNGTVVEYLKGSIKAHSVLQTDGTEADGLGFDNKGDLYVAYRSSRTNSIDEFKVGSSHGRSLGMQLDQPQGLVVAANGDILVVETGHANRIDEFLPGAKTPKLEVAVPSVPVQLAITESEKKVFVSTLGGNVYVASYPFDHPHLTNEVFGGYLTQGVALSNGQYF